jgi:hypothetical protein
MKIGTHEFPKFADAKFVFRAIMSDYPKWEFFSKDYQQMQTNGCKVFSKLFYKGGKLSDHGLKLKEGVSPLEFRCTYNALAGSWAPKHEIKTATCGMLIDEHTEPLAAKERQPNEH